MYSTSFMIIMNRPVYDIQHGYHQVGLLMLLSGLKISGASKMINSMACIVEPNKLYIPGIYSSMVHPYKNSITKKNILSPSSTLL